MPYAHLFGPVPSRRLGRSLGVDIVTAKVCNLNCVYCECGPTTKLTNERREGVPPQAVVDELSEFLRRSPVLDVVTITGSGEPTLNTGLRAIISFVKEKFPNYKTALLTNGTLLHLDDVRRAAALFDFVLPSLDAVSAGVFAKVNRPHRGLDNVRIIEGIAQFAREYRGRLWLEVFIVPGVNDTPAELSLLKEAILAIRPGRVQLNTLDRPGASASVRPATGRELLDIADFLRPAPVEIISRSYTAAASASGDAVFESSVLAMLRRRPCTVEDIAVASGRAINDVSEILPLLLAGGTVSTEAVLGRVFYKIK
ncbi:MAG TPA: radical SAM protein [Chitinivibrionales bacterium]|nr:radical SAM protein [Chitinivibrionales bacterium]